jgi:trk system potassium uptake protein TrkA
MRVVILGAGEVGRHLARFLSSEAEVVIIDRDADALSVAEEELDVLTMSGDVTHRRVLEQAEAQRADLCVSVTGHDAVNVAAAVLAKAVGAARVVARVDDPGFYRAQDGVEKNVAGIDACVCASRLIGGELLRLVTSIDCSFSVSLVGGAIHVAMVEIDDSSPAKGRSPNDLRSKGAAFVRGVVRGATVRAGVEVSALDAGDRIIIVGDPVAVAEMAQGMRQHEGGRAMLMGGGDVGLQLARTLGTLTRDVRVVESERQRCEELAKLVPNVTVLHGDSTNLAFLRDERVGLADLVLAVTGSDEINLMASLLCRELGARHTFALAHRPGYAAVYSHLGIEGTTSAHEVLARTLQWLLPRRSIVASAVLPGLDWELLEVRVPSQLRRSLSVQDLPLGAAAVPIGVMAAATPSLSPRVTGRLEGGEHIVVIAPKGAAQGIERALRRIERSH